MAEFKDVVHKLRDMSEGEIAGHLADRGIVGNPSYAMSCPIAKYVQEETYAKEVRVTFAHIDVEFKDGTQSSMMIPGTSIQSFVLRFDDGAYPNLVADRLE